MAKILISPLGVGGRFKAEDNSEREYQEAIYRIDDKSYPPSRFVASVLYEHFQLDGIIFIGTVKSMWEEVYRFFYEKASIDIDDEYWMTLAEKADKLNSKSNLDSLDLSKIDQVLGERSKCLLIKYGIDQSELSDNLDVIIEAVNSLQKGDELYIDITHSFRSLAIFQFLTITFINDLLADKEIKIKGVYYGMLDVIKEFNYAPIVDLKPLFDMTSWIKAAYTLQNFGNGYLIADLLRNQGEENIANRITHFSEAININYVPTIRQKVIDLKTSMRKNLSSPFKYLKPVIDKLIEQLSTRSNRESDFQVQLAQWYLSNRRYAASYITLTEAVITYLCELEERNFKNEDHRNEMKSFLHDNRQSDLFNLYVQVNPIRIAIAHASTEKKVTDHTRAIKDLKSYIDIAKNIFKTGTLNI